MCKPKTQHIQKKCATHKRNLGYINHARLHKSCVKVNGDPKDLKIFEQDSKKEAGVTNNNGTYRRDHTCTPLPTSKIGDLTLVLGNQDGS